MAWENIPDSRTNSILKKGISPATLSGSRCWLRQDALLYLGQAGIGGEVDHQRNIEGDDIFHGRPQKFPGCLSFLLGYFQDKFIMDLEDQSAAEPPFAQFAVGP